MTNARQVLEELKSLGTAQNRKVYARHGVKGDAFGVSYANLEKVRRSIGVDHRLAQALWKSGNHDARVLATKVADPEQASAELLDAWVKDLDSYVLADAFSMLAAASPTAAARSRKWRKSKQEYVSTAGWNVVGVLAPKAAMDVAELAGCLAAIERGIHSAPNRARHAMNQALIGIGLHGPELREAALAAAERIGTVEVDHGETGCKTPDAASYIRKTAEHRQALARRRAKKAAARKKPAARKAGRRP